MPPPSATETPRRSFRALFLSDFHLGARACKPAPILEFLRSVEAETIYLVGDILDLWHGGDVHWSETHDEIVTEIERHGRDGARVVYLPGNHDAMMRNPGARSFAHSELREAVIHRGVDGTRYLVLHGDQCDRRILRWHFVTRLGSRVDAMMRRIDTGMRRWSGLSEAERSVIERAIVRVNGMMMLGDRFETRLTALASATGAEGVICGHSHKPALRRHNGLAYANCGDWIDNFTALAEDHDGRLKLIEYVPQSAPRPVPGPIPVPVPVSGLVPDRVREPVDLPTMAEHGV